MAAVVVKAQETEVKLYVGIGMPIICVLLKNSVWS